MPPDLTYTPAAGHHWLTPLYDFGVAALTREKRWRSALIAQVRPRSGDVIVDVGCGTGSMLARLGKAAPSSRLIGIDPDPAILARARKRFAAFGLSVELHLGFARQAAGLLKGTRPTKVVSSLVFHQVPMDEKVAALAAMHAVLRADGEVHIADYGLQRTPLMRALFRGIIQNLDGRENTEPNARGVLRDLMRAAGFRNAEETLVIPTPSGSISLYRGSRIS
ncbi:class I SAM-dependent methyltransferase [Reyranella aquatilis]|uniref:Class I SAM-dependent methyltransferase n=1 Tax=Reyranella aquatilis TaxID=2035356 RepID=A0ABS8KVM8_9HYPH|nr:class I SAM-dependent methyltransferase [Reyranella aquatilis]MCC8430123.1 class I SAM-dependent methyltransferase [Reyranella aquatilis]